MTENEALNILVQVALKAQSVGALKLEESVLVKEAIDTFTTKEQVTEQVTEQVDKGKIKNLKPVTTEGAF
jgi:flagellar hook-basal body complex protein FliE